MNKKLHSTLAYAKYLYKGNSAHSIHSPFVFKLYNQAIKYNGKPIKVPEAEIIRDQLLKNESTIHLNGFGAGSRNYSTKRIKVKKHAKHSLKSKTECQLLHRIISHLAPQQILELGTSFGISSLYISNAAPNSQITSIEGEEEIQEIAQSNLQSKNVTSLLGDIDNILPTVLNSFQQLDCVIFDANHSYEPTLRYFEACLEQAHNDSFFIIDDIYWSPEMTRAWKQIIKDDRVTISIDLFHFGLVFFRKEQPKEHFTLRQFQLID